MDRAGRGMSRKRINSVSRIEKKMKIKVVDASEESTIARTEFLVEMAIIGALVVAFAHFGNPVNWLHSIMWVSTPVGMSRQSGTKGFFDDQ
jgi:hypothetical protein